MSHRVMRVAVAALLLLAPAGTLQAGFSGSDLFLPMVGRNVGVFPSNWYTTVWIYNPGTEAATARMFFLERGTANLAPPWVDVMVAPGDTTALENIVETLFHKQAFGALRVVCATQKLVVTSRVFSMGAAAGEKDSMGQDFVGVPASFAIGLGEKTQILGVDQTLPTADSAFRFNFGFVETTGHPATVRVSAYDEHGVSEGHSDFTVHEYSQRQAAFKDYFTTTSTQDTRLEVEVISGSGKVIAYGSGIANTSQDPTTFEMTYKDSLLPAGAAVLHDATLTGDGSASSPLGLADSAVTNQKVASGIAYGKLSGAPTALPPSGPAGGSLSGTYPYPAIANGVIGTDQLATNAVTDAKVASGIAYSKLSGAPASLPPSGAAGGSLTGTYPSPGIGANAIGTAQLAAAAVTDANVASGISYGKLSGAPTSLPPSGVAGGSLVGTYPNPEVAKNAVSTAQIQDGAVTSGKLSSIGGTAGQVLTSSGNTVSWQTPAVLTLPFSASTSSSATALTITNTAFHGVGVYGVGALGIKGSSTSGSGVAGSATGAGAGVEGTNQGLGGGPGVSGWSSSGAGVVGYSESTYGLSGVTGGPSSFAVHGYSNTFGSTGSLGGVDGVEGDSSVGDGVYGRSSGSFNTAGVHAVGTTGTSTAVWAEGAGTGLNTAGYFSGNVTVTGTLTKPGGSFKIDDPTDPEGKYLSHSFVESPDMKNVYDGVVTTDDKGLAVVQLPAWFQALNRDFRYQLTVIGRFAQAIVEQEIESNRFTIRTNLALVKVSWQVTGIRQDAWANAHRIPVEEAKPDAEQGSYLHPELYGQPKEKGVEWARSPEMMRQTK